MTKLSPDSLLMQSNYWPTFKAQIDASSNLLANPYNIGAGTWVSVGINSISANVIATPDGLVTAGKIIPNTGGGGHGRYSTTLVKAASVLRYRVGAAIKAVEYSACGISLSNNNESQNVQLKVNLPTGLYTYSTPVGFGIPLSISIKKMLKGYVAIEYEADSDNSTEIRMIVKVGSSGTTTSFTGDGTSGIIYAGGYYRLVS